MAYVRYDYVDIVGNIWWPCGSVASLRLTLTAADRGNIGRITRANLERWVSSHSGDFEHVIDFRASIGRQEIGFATEAGETAYLDTVSEYEPA